MMLLLQSDYLKVGGAEGKRAPYDMEDIRTCMRHVIDVDWGQTVDIAPDMKLTFHNAGHILGSSSVHLHVGDGKHNIVFSETKNTRNPGYSMLQTQDSHAAKHSLSNLLTVHQEISNRVVKKQPKNCKTLLAEQYKEAGS